MVRRTESQWRELFESQQNSGLNVAQYCRQHQLNAKYFSLRKRQLSKEKQNGFVQAKLPAIEMSDDPPIKLSRIRVIEIELDAAQLDVEALSSVLSQIFR